MELTWKPLLTEPWPEKPPPDSPGKYLKAVDRWSCRKMAEVRKKLRAKGDKRPLRRSWRGLELVVEVGSES